MVVCFLINKLDTKKASTVWPFASVCQAHPLPSACVSTDTIPSTACFMLWSQVHPFKQDNYLPSSPKSFATNPYSLASKLPLAHWKPMCHEQDMHLFSANKKKQKNIFCVNVKLRSYFEPQLYSFHPLHWQCCGDMSVDWKQVKVFHIRPFHLLRQN